MSDPSPDWELVFLLLCMFFMAVLIFGLFELDCALSPSDVSRSCMFVGRGAP